MRLVAIVLAAVLSGCWTATDEQLPVLALKLELPPAETKAFTEAMVRLAAAHKLRIEGPEAMPGQGVDDYIAVLRTAQGVSVSSYTDSEDQSGELTFYCTRGQPIEAANVELKRVVRQFAQLLESDWADKPLTAFTGYSTNRKELPLGDRRDLVKVLEAAAMCEEIDEIDGVMQQPSGSRFEAWRWAYSPYFPTIPRLIRIECAHALESMSTASMGSLNPESLLNRF